MGEDGDLRAAKEAGLTYIAYQSRSIREVRDKLSGKGFNADIIDVVIERFVELGYLNDRRFAAEWVESVAGSKLWGKRRIAKGLIAKGVKRGIVDDAVGQLDDAREAATARSALQAWRRRRSGKNCTTLQTRSAAYRHLVMKGFSTETVSTVVDELLKERDIDEG
ncbi:MAG: regulatory protein RecX [Thermodesulfobacteriota bacterium]